MGGAGNGLIGKGWLLFIVFALIIFAFKYDTLNDPYHWDALAGVTYLSLDMYDNDFRLLSADPNRHFGHPPLLYLSLALLWKILGYSIALSHAYIFFLGAIGLFFTYKIGEKLFNPNVGMAAAMLLLFNQLFFAQLGTLNDAVPVMTAGAMAVYFYIQDRKVLFIISGALMVSIKETAAVMLLAIFIHFIGERCLRQKKLTLNNILSSWFIILPLIPLLLWFAYQQLMIGWAFRTDLMLNAPRFAEVLRTDLMRYFIYDLDPDYSANKYNFILSVIILLALPLTLRSQKRKGCANIRSAFSLFALLIVANMVFYSLTADMPRYFVPIMPFFYLAGAGSAFMLLSRMKNKAFALCLFTLLVGVCIGLFITNYHGNRSVQGWQLESNMEYKDMIETHLQAIRYIEENYPEATIITSWPMSDELEDPRSGYLNERRKGEVLQIEWITGGLVDAPLPEQSIILYSPQSSRFMSSFNQVIQSELVLVKRFEIRNKFSEIYIYPPQEWHQG